MGTWTRRRTQYHRVQICTVQSISVNDESKYTVMANDNMEAQYIKTKARMFNELKVNFDLKISF